MKEPSFTPAAAASPENPLPELSPQPIAEPSRSLYPQPMNGHGRGGVALEPAVVPPWFARAATLGLLGFAAVFFLLHFLHLAADFPNNSPWVDWAKYTDEGWYGDAAIRHYFTGHWYWKGDFNPAVALPLWPALEWIVFRFTGVSPAAARSLALCVFALTLLALYRLLARHTHGFHRNAVPPLAAPLAIFLLCLNPFVYVFERMAVLEPLLIALGILAMLAASHLHPLAWHLRPLTSPRGRSTRASGRERMQAALPTLWLTLLLPAMVLTKTTAVFLLPAIGYMVWARAGYRLRPALRLAAIPAVLGAALWGAYFFLFVRPHYMEDFRYLFYANAHTGIDQPFASTVLTTVAGGAWMGTALYTCFFAVVALAIFWRPRLFANPLVPAFLLWIGGYTAFLIYHNTPQPRYYLVLAIPVTAVVALGLDFLPRPGAFRDGERVPEVQALTPRRLEVLKPAARVSQATGVPRTAGVDRGNQVSQVSSRVSRLLPRAAVGVAAAAILAIAIPDALLELDFVRHPTYDFEAAAQAIKRIVLADRTHSDLILSISGSDLTLMTGLPSIDDDFGTLELGNRVDQYRPGWFVSWNKVEDDKADALSPFYRLERVAAFPAMDDPDRNLLILYRLDPVAPTPSMNSAPTGPAPRRRVLTRAGQQPSTAQLKH